MASFVRDVEEFRVSIADPLHEKQVDPDFKDKIPNDIYKQYVAALSTMGTIAENISTNFLQQNYNFLQDEAIDTNLAKIEMAEKLLSKFVEQNPNDDAAVNALNKLDSQIDCVTSYAVGPAYDPYKSQREREQLVADSGKKLQANADTPKSVPGTNGFHENDPNSQKKNPKSPPGRRINRNMERDENGDIVLPDEATR